MYIIYMYIYIHILLYIYIYINVLCCDFLIVSNTFKNRSFKKPMGQIIA